MHYLCSINSIPEGKGRTFAVQLADGQELQIFVVRHQGQFYAYENACAHFGVRLDVTPEYSFLVNDEIVCQVHYARYDPVNGNCIRGDCDGQALRSLPLCLEASKIFLRV